MKLPLILFAAFFGLVVMTFRSAFSPRSSHVGFDLVGSAGITLLVVSALLSAVVFHTPSDLLKRG